MDCGFLTVPQVRSDPQSGTFDLTVAVLRTDNPAPSDDPIVYLAGGPGENALATLAFTFEALFKPLLEDRDVVLFDQRGVGFSEPAANCDELVTLALETLDDGLEIDEAIDRSIAAAKTCHDRLDGLGFNLAALNTAESAADVDDLRRALGYERWNLLGISYGTRLAQTVMRDYPNGVRSVILDSTVPIEADLIAQTPGSIDRAFNALFESCASHPTCGADYPALRASLDRAFDRLNSNPLPGRVLNPLTGVELASVATGVDLVDQVFQGLYSAKVIPLLPEMIARAAAGDVGMLDVLRGQSLANLDFISTGVHLAVQCQDEVHFTSQEALERAAAPFSEIRRFLEGERGIGTDLLETCAYWDVGGAADIENEPVDSGIPTLVLAGQFDPITPPSGGETVSRRLENATFVRIPSFGHAVLADGECPHEIARSFLAAPEKEPDTSCTAGVPPPAWARPVRTVTLVPFDEPLFGYRGLRPDGWTELAPGLASRTELGIVTQVQQVIPGLSPLELRGLLTDPFGEDLGFFGSPVDTIDANGLSWEVYEAAAGGRLLQFAFAANDQATAMVMLTGIPGQREDLRQYLLLPTIRAFEVLR